MTKICKLCQQPKDNYDLTASGKTINWCKDCRTLSERALRAYTRLAPKPRSEWPSTFLDDVAQLQAMIAAGGTPYRRQKVEAMLRHCDWQPEPTDNIEVSAEAFLYLMDRVDELERLIHNRSKHGSSTTDEADARYRQFTDALNKLPGFLPPTDLAHYREALRRCYSEVQRRGYPLPATVRDLVVPLDVGGVAMPLELIRIYNSIILPALTSAKDAEEYPQLVAEIEDLTGGLNLYELDWLELPFTEEYLRGIF